MGGTCLEKDRGRTGHELGGPWVWARALDVWGTRGPAEVTDGQIRHARGQGDNAGGEAHLSGPGVHCLDHSWDSRRREMADGGGGERTEGLGDRGMGDRGSGGTEGWGTEGLGESGPRVSGGRAVTRLALVSPPLLGSFCDGTPGLTGSPSRAGRSHREQRHRPVPGGGDVQGRQLWAPAGGAEVLRAEVDHQKLDQARAALTPRLTLCPRPSADPEDLGQAWGPSHSAYHWNPEGPGRACIPSGGGTYSQLPAGPGDMGTWGPLPLQERGPPAAGGSA